MPRALWLLTAVASLLTSAVPLVLLVGGFVGGELAPSPSLATLPIALLIVGTALSSYPVIRLMGVFGRKPLFIFACGVLIFACISASFSLISNSFLLFCGSMIPIGFSHSVWMQFRFAAIDFVGPEDAGKAAARIMLSGLAAAIIGPDLSRVGEFVTAIPFIGAFVLMIALTIIAALLLIFFYQEPKRNVDSEHSKAVDISTVLRNPVFYSAVASSMVGFAVMSLIMTATPLTMHVHHGMDLVHTKEVIQAHIVAMFLPSFFAGYLVARFGAVNIALLGALIYVLSVVFGLAGVHLFNFWGSLVLLGIGWNFMFLGGTSLLAKSYLPEQRFKVQAINDLAVFSGQALAALSAGWLLHHFGWFNMLLSCLPIVVICSVFIFMANRANLANRAAVGKALN